jgi:hypothetical protein
MLALYPQVNKRPISRIAINPIILHFGQQVLNACADAGAWEPALSMGLERDRS